MSSIQEVKERIDIVEYISESVKLRKAGNSYSGFCPFHENKNTPALAVWPDSGTWRCFGACNEGGDVFKFVMKKEGWDFGEALRHLAQRAGVELDQRTPEQEAHSDELDRLRTLLELAANYYSYLLQQSSHAEAAREHLAQRPLPAEAIEKFELGFALDSWDSALIYFREKGYSVDELLAAGLVARNEKGRVYDRFRNRMMIPIRDSRGRMTGFGARVLVDEGETPSGQALAKFINSPQTELFDKSALLYGLDRARKAMRETGVAVLVEGYMDVMAAHMAGFENVVSPMGTALTERQLRLIKRFARRLILALDPDVAGDKAVLRGLEVARDTLDRDTAPKFNPRGLVRNEGQLKLDIRVATLPDDLDPDELIAQDAAAWRELIDSAQPVVEYVMGALTADRNLDDPKVKAEVAEQLVPLINEVRDPIERSTYRQKLSLLLRVPERALMGTSPRQVARGQQATRKNWAVSGETQAASASFRPDALSGVAATTPDGLESYCLQGMVQEPDLLARIDRHLRELELAPLAPQDFANTGFEIIFRELRMSLHQDETAPVNYLLERLEDSLRQQLVQLQAGAQSLDLDDERRIEDILQASIRLRKRNIGTWLQELRFMQQAAQEADDNVSPERFQDEIVAQIAALQRINKALGKKSRREKVAGRVIVA